MGLFSELSLQRRARAEARRLLALHGELARSKPFEALAQEPAAREALRFAAAVRADIERALPRALDEVCELNG